jgi:hypothetical protein
MTSKEEFSPQDFRVEETDGGKLRLIWSRYDGEHRVIVLDRSLLPAVTRELRSQGEDDEAASTDIEEVLSGEEARVAGLGFTPEADHLRLTVYVEPVLGEDQEVEIALRLSKNDVINCMASMTEWLDQAREAH